MCTIASSNVYLMLILKRSCLEERELVLAVESDPCAEVEAATGKTSNIS